MHNINPRFDVLKEYFNYDNIYHSAQILSETTIGRLLNQIKKHGGIIISANVGLNDEGEIPEKIFPEYAKWCNEKHNEDKELFVKERSNKETKNLIADIKSTPFTYSPVYGGYKSNDNITDLYEPSFVVYNMDRKGQEVDFETLKELAFIWCKKYKQDSVYVREPNGKSHYYDGDGNVLANETDAPTKINRTEEPYFTALKKNKPQRFTDTLDWLDEGKGVEGMWYSNPCACTLNELRRRQEGLGERVFKYGNKDIL